MNSRRAKAIGILFISVISVSSTQAMNIEASAVVDTKAGHDDNIRLVQKDKTAVNEIDLAPQLNLDVRTENTTVHLGTIVKARRFNRSEFNSDDQNVNLSITHSSERASFGIGATYIHDSTLTSELLSSGRIGTKADRSEQYLLAPSFSYALSETNRVALTGQYASQDYGSAAYIGYSDASADLSWTYLESEQLKWILSASYSDYRSEDMEFGVPTRTVFGISGVNGLLYFIRPGAFGTQAYATRMQDKGLSGGFDYQFTERSLIKLRLGWAKDRLTFPINDHDNVCENPFYLNLPADIKAATGAICDSIPDRKTALTTAAINWSWLGENQKVVLDLSKATQPTSNGYAVDATRLKSTWSYQISELDKIILDISLAKNRAISNESTLQNTSLADRNFGTARLSYQKQISERWFADLSYQYTTQKYTQTDYEANSKTIAIGINYRPAQWFWSR